MEADSVRRRSVEVVRDRQGLGKGCLLLPTLFNLYSYVWNGRGIGTLYRMGVTKGVDNGGAGGGLQPRPNFSS